MSDEHHIFVTVDEYGNVAPCSYYTAQARVILSVVDDMIVHGSVELINDAVEDEAEEDTDKYRQLDLVDLLANPKWGNQKWTGGDE